MGEEKRQQGKGRKWFRHPILFPAAILAVYLILLVVVPEKGTLAFESCGRILRALIVPLCLVFAVMVVFNLVLKPAQIVRLLGRGSGMKGVLLSVGAGIISMGPIYAWYPLLKDLKEKGAANSLLAVFLYNRAVKPFLLPVMIAYFGWLFVVLLTVLTVLASVGVGYAVGVLLNWEKRRRS